MNSFLDFAVTPRRAVLAKLRAHAEAAKAREPSYNPRAFGGALPVKAQLRTPVMPEMHGCPVLWGRVSACGKSATWLCRRCSAAVSVCGRCDRGNIDYAGDGAERQRRESLRHAGAHYQRTGWGASSRRPTARLVPASCAKSDASGCATAGAVVTLSITAKVATMELSNAN